MHPNGFSKRRAWQYVALALMLLSCRSVLACEDYLPGSPVLGSPVSGSPATSIPAESRHAKAAHAGHDHSGLGASSAGVGNAQLDFFTNYGNYMPRVHCLQSADGSPDWPWIGALLALHALILAGYLKIFLFWRKCYVNEALADREKKLWSLALLFLTCAFCGYGMSMLMFVWPAYRLLALMMAVLVFATWRFAWNLKPFEDAFAAKRGLREGRHAAEIASRSKSEFLANMSHEIRTPMTAILGFAEAMLDAKQSEKERLNCVHTIRRNGDYLLQIINDILDLSKIESGKMQVEQIEVDVCRIIAEVNSLMRVRVEAKGLTCEYDYVGPIPKTIRSDPTRLRQILINLMGNAIKFTEFGSVRLETRMVSDGERQLLQFDVIDTGCGMGEEQQAALFQPFSQADNSTTREFGGTGLGLSISKKFAELLGGDVTLDCSELGQGSTFRATVCAGPAKDLVILDDPRASTVVQESDDEASEAKGLSGLRILLAEDGPDNQRLIAFILKKSGAEVTVAENGQVARDLALEAYEFGSPFDVILMDMQMPILDGYSATRMLRSKGYAGQIIALTAHAMAGDREKCLEAGCDDYATKPVERRALVAQVAAASLKSTKHGAAL